LPRGRPASGIPGGRQHIRHQALLRRVDRAAELATIRNFGWREAALQRLVITEGAIIGLAGSIVGAVPGLIAAADFAGQRAAALYIVAAGAVVTGAVVTAAAAPVPAHALRRMPAAHLLAEEQPGLGLAARPGRSLRSSRSRPVRPGSSLSSTESQIRPV
jgi:hypothetical protein